MADFYNILKRGKSAAATTTLIKDEWIKDIGIIIGYLHHLNDLYPDKGSHNASLELCECEVCGKPNYVLAVVDIDNDENKLYYCHGDWQALVGGVYRCPTCKT